MTMSLLPPVVLEIKAIGGELKAKIGEAKAELTDLESTGNARMKGLANAGKIAAVGVAVAGLAIAGASTKLAVDYQSSMATVQGAAQLTAPQVKAVGDAFLGTAGKSTFSAQEMATALGPVAGVVNRLSGGTLTAASSLQLMRGATDLAEASGLSLTSTTADLAKVMLAYGLKTKDAGETSNQLFNTSRLTGVGLDTLTGVVTKLRGKLGEVAPTLADTGGLLVDLAQHGVSGSRGVMIANTGLQTLLGGSKSTSAELKTLGARLYDNNGKFVGLQSILAQVSPKLAGMSEQQRRAAESALFGKGAAAGLNSTILAGVAGLNKAKDAVEKKDAVDKAATAQAATMKGQLHLVAATAEDLGVKIGTLLIPVIQKAITVIGSIVTWLTQHKTVAMVLAGVIGGLLVAATVAWAVSLFTAGGALAFLMSPITLVVVGIGLLVAGIIYAYNHFQTFHNIVNAVWEWLKGAVVATIGFVKDHWQLIVGVILGPVALVAVGVVTHWTQIKGFISAAVGTIRGVLGWFGGLPGLFSGWFSSAKDAASGALGSLVSFVAGLPGRILSGLGNLGGLLVSAGVNIVKGLISGIGSMATALVHALVGLLPGPLKKFASLLGLASPSTVFAGFGTNIVQGLINGIEGSKGALGASVASLANMAASPSISPIGGPAFAGGASGGTGSPATGGSPSGTGPTSRGGNTGPLLNIENYHEARQPIHLIAADLAFNMRTGRAT